MYNKVEFIKPRYLIPALN